MTPRNDPARGHPLDRIPRWLPPVVYAALTALIFRTYLPASAEEMLLGQDTIAAGVLFRTFFVEQVRLLGRMPLWNPYVYGGVPTIEAGSGDFLYPASILHFLLPLTRALAWKLIVHVFLAGVFMYLAARAFGTRRLIALFAGTAYLMSANLVSLVWGGQDGKMYVIALFPAGLWLLKTGLERPSWLRLLWLGAVAGLMLVAHPQLAYYAYLALGAYGVGMLWVRRRDGKGVTVARLAGGAGALLVALAVAAVVLLPMFSYLREFSPRAGGGRGFAYAASYSLHFEEAVGLFIPDFAGTEVQANTYWGKNALKHNLEYGGVLVFVLGIAALAALKGDSRRWGLGAMAGVALLYALGAETPFFRLVYALVPGVRYFRAPSLAMFVCLAALTTLAALLVQRAWGGEGPGAEEAGTRRLLERFLVGAAALAAAVAVVVQVGGVGAFDPWFGLFGGEDPRRRAALAENISHIVTGAWVTTGLCGAAWGAAALARSGKLTPRLAVVALIALTGLDLLRVNHRYIQVVRFDAFFPDDPGVRALGARLAPGERVLAVPGVYPSGFLAAYGVPEAFGYHGNQLRWYDDYTRRNEREGGAGAAAAEQYWIRFLQSPVLQTLAVRYVVLPAEVTLPGYELVARGGGIALFRYDAALGGATVVPHAARVPLDEQTGDLWDSSFDVRDSLLLVPDAEDPGGATAGSGGRGSADVSRNGADEVVVQARTDGPSWLLLSRAFHPSWTATLDGEPAPVLRANVTLMAVRLPRSGTHEVVLRYRPRIVIASARVSAAAWIAILVASAGAAVARARRFRRERTDDA